jgi:hypothetical protein
MGNTADFHNITLRIANESLESPKKQVRGESSGYCIFYYYIQGILH